MSPKVQHFQVTREESGQKLFQFLARRLGKDIPGSAIMRWIRSGQVRVDSSRARPFDRVVSEQVVRVPPFYQSASTKQADVTGGPEPEILFEDSDLLVLNKPRGLVVHPGSGHSWSVTQWLAARYEKSSWQPTPLHRLDRDTTGLLVAAKSYDFFQHLQTIWKSGQVTKLYLAWINGSWGKECWTELSGRMKRTARQGFEKMETGQGKKASSRVKALLDSQEESLVGVMLETGRTHQIRVQLAESSHPVIGDGKYGRTRGKQPLLLHAWHITFEDRQFTAGPPWTGKYALPHSLRPEDVI